METQPHISNVNVISVNIRSAPRPPLVVAATMLGYDPFCTGAPPMTTGQNSHSPSLLSSLYLTPCLQGQPAW